MSLPMMEAIYIHPLSQKIHHGDREIVRFRGKDLNIFRNCKNIIISRDLGSTFNISCDPDDIILSHNLDNSLLRTLLHNNRNQELTENVGFGFFQIQEKPTANVKNQPIPVHYLM